MVAALEFWITSFCFPKGPFVALLEASCPAALVLATTPRRCNKLPDVIFLDLLLLPSVSKLETSYWRSWAVPHVFFLWAGDTDSNAPSARGKSAHVAPQPPGGWTMRNLTLTHCEAGGGTSGRWELVGWYPPGVMAPSPFPIDPLPWFPIRSSVMDRVAARPVRATLSQGDSLPVPVVVRRPVESVGGGGGTPH